MTLGIELDLFQEIKGVSHRFFGRIGGTSPDPFRGLNTSFDVDDSPARVEENLARVRFQLGLRPKELITLEQVHGTNVIVLDEKNVDEVQGAKADGMISRLGNIGLGIRSADCAPMLWSSRDGRVVGAAHAGWRGASSGIIHSMLEGFKSQGVLANELCVGVGPCIQKRSFEVGVEVLRAFKCSPDSDLVELSEKEELGREDALGHEQRYFFDLSQWLLDELQRCGVHRCARINSCTKANNLEYFSYRRNPKTGRQLSVIGRFEAPVLLPETFS